MRHAQMAPSEDPRRGLGRRGEVIAANRLEEAGYRILARNYRCAIGEIDIIAEDGDCVVLVEVRTRRGRSHGTPEESITPAKRERLRQLAEAWLQTQDPPPLDCRVDVVAVELAPNGTLMRVTQVRNALV
jgi:putative endonuclease